MTRERALIGTVGTILNTIQIASLLYSKRTKLPFDVSLISLAAADLSVSLVFFIGNVIQVIDKSLRQNIADIVMCDLIFSSTSSTCHLVFIAIQRLIAVQCPLRFAIWLTRERCIRVIATLWVFSILVTVPAVTSGGQTYMEGTSYLPIPIGIVLSICYGIICYRMLVRKNIAVSGNVSNQNSKIVLYSVIVSAAYIISTWPLSIGMGLKANLDLLISLYMMNAVLDPIIYFLFQYCKSARCLPFCKCAENGQDVEQRNQNVSNTNEA